MSKQFEQFKLKPNDLFTVPAIKGLYNHEQFAHGAKTRQMPVDWTIINDAFESSMVEDRTGESSEASGILQSEHGDRIRTRNQHRMSFNELSFNELTPQMTSTPIRPWSRQSDRSAKTRSVSRASHTSLLNLFTPPSAFRNASGQDLPTKIAPPPNWDISIDFNDEFNFSNQNQTELRSVLSDSSRQHANNNGQSTMEFEVDESEDHAVEHTDLMAALGQNSSEYRIVTKLIRLWQKKIHPIHVDHLLTKGCNRFQAAKTFSSLLSKYHYMARCFYLFF